MKNILVVDDTPANLRLLTDMLKQKNYRVRPVLSGELALKAVAQEVPDLILLDINMPEMDGYAVCRKLKTTDSLKDIPVIFISASNEIFDKVKAFSCGGVDYITKPFQFEEVEARVETHLNLTTALKTIKGYNDQLEELLAERTKELIRSERQAAFGQLVQGIVHNLRGPLTAISMAGQVLQATIKEYNKEMVLVGDETSHGNDTLVTEVQHTAGVVKKSMVRIEDMVNSLLAKSRSDKSVESKLIDLNEIIRMEIEFLEADPRFKHAVEKEICLSADSMMISVVPGEIAQVIQNIVGNALDALGRIEDGRITIRTGKRENVVELVFMDNGPGIPVEIRERIFDPFFTTKRPREEKSLDSDEPVGTGLGLWMCHEIITSYGGTIQVDANENGGAIFTLKIPLFVSL